MTAAVIVLAGTLAAAIALAAFLGVMLVKANTAARAAQDFATQAVKERDAVNVTATANAAHALDLEDQLAAVTDQRNALAKKGSTDARETVLGAGARTVDAANGVLQPLRDRRASDPAAARSGDGPAADPVQPVVATDDPAYRRRT